MSLSSSNLSESGDRILVVDDLPDNCLLLQTLLESEGYEVEVAYNGYKALDLIALNPPSLILLDVMMPEMSGLEVIRRVRQNSSLPFIPIVLVTGYCESHLEKDSDEKADGLISKPIDFDHLLNLVQIVLQKQSNACEKLLCDRVHLTDLG